MKIKFFVGISFLLIVTILFSACTKENNVGMKKREEFVQGFMVDNVMPLEECLTKVYELQELKSFFGDISPNEYMLYEMADNRESFNISSVNERFPIECLRKIENIVYYSVYKVSGGGYFYVFWTQTFKELPTAESKPKTDDATVYFTAYISSMPKESDFVSIQEETSTAEDVFLIDQAFELSFLMSSGIRSYSLLENGKIMEISYENSDNIKSRKDLIVKRKNIISKEMALSASYLATIDVEDLP